MAVTKEAFLEEMLKACEDASLVSHGRLRLALNEEDTTTDRQMEAAHFLKLEGE